MSPKAATTTPEAPAPPSGARAGDRREPPVLALGTASLILIVIGGIYMSAYVPRNPPLALPTVLLALGALCTVAAVVAFLTARGFALATFGRIYRWAILAYGISAGMIEFAFVKDKVPARPLTILTLMLVVYAVDVPMLIAYTVARHDTGQSGSPRDSKVPG